MLYKFKFDFGNKIFYEKINNNKIYEIITISILTLFISYEGSLIFLYWIEKWNDLYNQITYL